MRFFYAKYETFDAVFHSAYLIGRSYQHSRQPYMGLSSYTFKNRKDGNGIGEIAGFARLETRTR